MAEDGSEPRSILLPQLGDRQFAVVAVASVLLLIALTVKLRFCYDVSLPEKPPRPRASAPPSASEASAALDSTSAAWRQHLADGAKEYGITVRVDEMTRAFAHREHNRAARLIPGGADTSLEAAGLRITAQVRDLSGTRMLVLVIDNLTDRDLAYRIDARPMRGARRCRRDFVSVPYDALVVRARRSVIRAECKHEEGGSPGLGIEVLRVETMALPPLAARQVSDTPPEMFGLDRRLARGHQPATTTCRVALSESTRQAIASGAYRWRDVVDFFARHWCRVYKKLPDRYRAFHRDQERPLPATD